MENEQIVDALELLVKLWDVHGINEFKSKNLSFAARALDKFPGRISNLSESELYAIPGVGKVVIQLIQDIAHPSPASSPPGTRRVAGQSRGGGAVRAWRWG